MKVHLITVAAVALAGAAQAQSAPPAAQTQPPSSTLTRDLNSGPPAAAAYIAPAPSTAPVANSPASRPAAARPAVVAVPSVTAPPAGAAPARTVPVPASTAPAGAAPAAPPATTSPASAVPAPAPASPPPPPAVATVTVLDAAARAALPFSVSLPTGFEIVTGRPGPDFRIYTIRRGDRSFVMVYAGPASQFPIYSGEMVEAGGRNSVVATEGGVRHAKEHLFQRAVAPREVHVWTMSLDGADRALAEQIAQSVDVR
ncbi:MAG TPA: hypothetical protein VFF48_08940 [Brevundimonas sp.]|nr:hypothetical protein [Brevundimonas sp.]